MEYGCQEPEAGSHKGEGDSEGVGGWDLLESGQVAN